MREEHEEQAEDSPKSEAHEDVPQASRNVGPPLCPQFICSALPKGRAHRNDNRRGRHVSIDFSHSTYYSIARIFTVRKDKGETNGVHGDNVDVVYWGGGEQYRGDFFVLAVAALGQGQYAVNRDDRRYAGDYAPVKALVMRWTGLIFICIL